VGRADNAWEGPFWLVFQRSSNPIGLLDDERRWVDVNAAGVELLGRSREEIVGSPAVDSIPAAHRARWEQEWEMLVRDGHITHSGPLLRADGSEVEVESAAAQAVIGGRRLVVFVLLSPPPAADGPAAEPSSRVLTDREREIVSEIALGGRTPEIAADLYISADTVRTHVRNAMAKLGARTRAQLVAIALSAGEFRYPSR
jgi:PAS domain S-box-containing protein